MATSSEGMNIRRELKLMASEGSAGYVLAVVDPPPAEGQIEFFMQPDPTMHRAEVGSFKGGGQFFAYHQASIDFMGSGLSEATKETRIRKFGQRLVKRVEGLELIAIEALDPRIEEKIKTTQQKEACTNAYFGRYR